jgi:hypothetical protein
MSIHSAYAPSAISPGYTWRWVSIFAIAFGFLEAIVVVYLRLLYYPEGFTFPLILAHTGIYAVEIIREISTLLMLVATGMLAGKNALQRFAWFLYAFAIWDICYYAALKFFLDWPPSLLTWDVLFLIPVVWVGPVLAPLICSVIMIGFTVVVIESGSKGRAVIIRNHEWVMMAAGAFIVFYTFIRDYSFILIRTGFFSGVFFARIVPAIEEMLDFIPVRFDWLMFSIGEILIMISIFLFGRRNHLAKKMSGIDLFSSVF